MDKVKIEEPFWGKYVGRPAILLRDYYDWKRNDSSVILDIWLGDGPYKVLCRLQNSLGHDFSVVALEWLYVQ